MTHELLGTKTIVSAKDVLAFNRCLYIHGFGYDLALEVQQPKMKKTDFTNGKPVGFMIDYNGIITFTLDIQDMRGEYESTPYDELKWEFYFDGTGIS